MPLLPASFSPPVEGLDDLVELALDLRWSWSHHEDELWGPLNPDLWELTHNPWVVLQTLSVTRLKALAGDEAFRKQVEYLVNTNKHYLELPTWFQNKHALSPISCVAYLCMEFMLSEALPIYSGGLGNVAGDCLKAASDLGVPVIGIGLLYQQGYFRQVIDADGAQEALYPYNEPAQLPIVPARNQNGEWIRLEVSLPGYKAWVRAWEAKVGRTKLYLLDTNDPANQPIHRSITSELYGGGSELRLVQEVLLGIFGWRLLEALGYAPEVCHLNEGHAAFAVLERARSFMRNNSVPFNVALTATRAGNLFTTHTPVSAGFDRFAPALIEKYFNRYCEAMGITLNDLLALGRANPADSDEPLNMAYLAIRGSGAVNGVSRLHGKVSRTLFRPLFPRWPDRDVPVDHVTNGVHMPSWDSEGSDILWTEACGKDRWQGMSECLGDSVRRISDDHLWQLRSRGRKNLVEHARRRLARQWAAAGASPREIEDANHVFDPDVLTLGFARRFASYKRPTLLLHDPARLLSILTNSERPVQLVIAGKAHPADQQGQHLLQAWTSFARRPEVAMRVAFLGDYDMLLTERLVEGVDVWINTPRRPWEASGTSGMKVLVNGGLNLSELDGWWAEAYNRSVGWAIGDGREHGEDPAWDAASELYDRLEHEVIPVFYSRDSRGIPVEWIARIRESMSQLTLQYSADRMLREYTQRFYTDAAGRVTRRSANGGALARQIIEWQERLSRSWNGIHFGEVHVDEGSDFHSFSVEVFLNGLTPDAVRVELYADPVNGHEQVRQEMTPARGQLFEARVPATRPASDYTPRVIPRHPDALVPLEALWITWQR
jgi:glycogen phosphorylase